ncbi:conjugal transfer protein TraV [Sphingobium sp.]|uniref:conjugal transfer protein TraV n=1 Tax=Sphingobium sp. TaxID=1912891 RepID=UPI0028BE406B|nr:conjugal transfer protein TraV [Sphingobium sp.]
MSGAVTTRTLALMSSVLACLLSAGCASLGGNVKGSFACAAPDGICAPSAVIDDRALAMITDDPSATPSPAGPYEEQPRRPAAAKVAAAERVRMGVSADATRSRERVMRIVFPAFIDESGRLHEASAIRAVVAQGEWQSAPEPQEAAISRNALSAAPQMQSLADAVSRDEPPLAVDPDLPTPAVVEAARARKADPVTAIKADVARRLETSARAGSSPSPATPASKAAPPAPAALSSQPVPASAAAASASAPPKPVVQPLVRAAAFPAAIPEDD